MKKRFFSLLAVCALVLGLMVPVGAVELPGVECNGVETGYVPRLLGGRSYLPAEETAALLGAELTLEGGSAKLYRGGESVVLPLTRVGEEECLPLRQAGTALGYQVGWDRESRRVLLVDLGLPAGGQSGKVWRLEETQVQAGWLTAAAKGWAEQLVAGVDPAWLLSAIPLTDGDTALELMAGAAKALEQPGAAVVTAGDTTLELWREGERSVLTLTVPAAALLPAETLGVKGKTVTLSVETGAEEARALVRLGNWQASARWTA